MRIKCTVISHFFNEEYLLPWWLNHHTKLFDHGILINRASTDRSIEICRKLAPNWRVLKAHNPAFDAIDCDREVMKIEFKIEGWKIVLNTTEFLCCHDLNKYLEALEFHAQQIYLVPTYIMVDPPDIAYPEPNPEQPLVNQRHHGFYSRTRSRFIHKLPHGGYHPGRHETSHAYKPAPSGAFIKWFGFSPWNEHFKKRKLQIKPTIPESNYSKGFGIQHFVDVQQLEELYCRYVNQAQDLHLFEAYRTLFPK
jgi:hypothetical protein